MAPARSDAPIDQRGSLAPSLRCGESAQPRLARNGVDRRLVRPVISSWLKELRGAQGRNRTTDTVIFSHVLYQLSYLGDLRTARRAALYRGSSAGCPAAARNVNAAA